MKKRNVISVLVLILLISTQTWAQKERYASLREALFSGGQLSGPAAPANINWIEGGDKYSFTRTNSGFQEIWTYNIKKDAEELVFTAEGKQLKDGSPFRYTSFRWSKDYKYLLFQTNFRPIWRNSGNADYYYYSVDSKKLDLIVESAFTAELSPDGSKVGYGKEGDLYEFALATGEHTRFTDDAHGQVYNGRFGWAQEEEFGLVQGWKWSHDSKYMAYWQSDESKVPIYKLTDFSGLHPRYAEVPYPKVGDPAPTVKIGVIDTESKEKKWLDIDLDGGYIPRIYWTAKEATLAVVWTNRIQNELKLFFFDVNTGAKKLVMEEKSDSWIDIYDFFAGRLDHFYFPGLLEEFFWISERDGWAHIYRFDYNGELLQQVTKGEWEVTGIDAIDVRRKEIYYVSTEVAPTERNLFRIRFDGSKKERITTEEGHHTVNMSPNANYFIDAFSNVNTPPLTLLKDKGGKTLKILADNQAVLDYLENHNYAYKEMFSFTTSDGQKLDGYLMKPLDFDPQKSYPLYMDIYGGPGSQGVYNTFSTSGWHQWLAQNGYVIVSVNNRGNGGYGSAFEKVVHRQLGKWESHDFVETALYLAKNPWVDKENMAIRGHSFGGFTSSYTMVTHPGIFKASLVGAPVTDHLLYDCILTERYMGGPVDNAEGYKQSAVTSHAANLEGKMLLVHSLMDDNVHPQNTFQLVKAFIDAGKDVDLRIYPPGTHGVAYNLNAYILLYQQYMDYLEEHLK